MEGGGRNRQMDRQTDREKRREKTKGQKTVVSSQVHTTLELHPLPTCFVLSDYNYKPIIKFGYQWYSTKQDKQIKNTNKQ